MSIEHNISFDKLTKVIQKEVERNNPEIQAKELRERLTIENKQEVTVDDPIKCRCNRALLKKGKDITTYYMDKKITVQNVPLYECSKGHITISRTHRVKLKETLKKGYEANLDVLEYNPLLMD